MTKVHTKIFSDVKAFMNAAGQETLERPVLIETPQALLYKDLIKEEFQEFFEADSQNDDTERLDACFDMMWVIVGYMLSRGWDVEKAWDEGAHSNLVKIDAKTGKVIKRPDGKIMKPEGWTPPNFEQFIK